MKRRLTILLVIIMIVCFGGAISYPLLYHTQKNNNEADMEDLRTMRNAGLEKAGNFPSAEEASQQNTEPAVDAANGQTQAEPTETDLEVLKTTKTAATDLEDLRTAEPVGTDDEAFPAAEHTSAAADSAAVTSSPEKEIRESNGLEQGEPEIRETPETKAAGETQMPIDTQADDDTSEGEQLLMPRFENELPAASPEPYSGALPYPQKEKVSFDEGKILPQYRDIYALNNDMVGWLQIDGTGIDHPVLQNEDDNYYLKHDFYGRSNQNGQLLIFASCDVYTPSYNVVISAHNMRSGKMFGRLMNYASRSFWSSHKTFTFDTIMREGTYVVVAAFFSADYNENEEGFRYLVDILYPVDYRSWIREVAKNAIYETGIDTRFGDEFLTLTTCAYQRRNGRFVVIARRLREGEVIE